MLDDYNMVNDTSAPLDTETSPSKPTQPTKPTDDGAPDSDNNHPLPTDESLIDDQRVFPLRGKCYDHEDGGMEGDGSGCYGIATRTWCQADVAECEANAACRDMEACHATCNGKSGDAWQTCLSNCRATNLLGEALFDAYRRCIYCDACAVDCKSDSGGMGCGITLEACYFTSRCYGDEPDGSPGCWDCAMAYDCYREVDACHQDADCHALDQCIALCNNGPRVERDSCVDACYEGHDGDVALLDAYHYCVYCTAGCKQLCPTDGPSCM